MTTGSILLVDDEPIHLEILADFLVPEYKVTCASSGPQALQLIAAAAPDLVLLDVNMPGMDGYELCAQLKARSQTADIPIIFVTALGDVAAEARGLELGAADYVTKPFNPTIVVLRVRNHIALKRARDELERLGTMDGLTGLATRRRFDMALMSEVNRLSRTGALLSLVMLDVDHFKLFNDTYGHVAGDDCLRKVGGAVAAAAQRPADLAARYGGEEFACILPDTDLGGAELIAEAVRQRVASLAIPHAKSSAASHVTASVGFITTFCRMDLAPTTVIAAADRNLYRAKEGGRNRALGGLLTQEEPAQ
jgi:diguanylate cyclase (GGDEF)-like protein